jgi:ribonuclease R
VHFTDRSLLEHIRKLPHGKATYKQLVKELRLTGENRDALEDILDRLADKGLLVELRSGHGDRALVHVTRRSAEGRAEGELVRVLRRAHFTVVGEFRVRKRGNFVVPSDDRIQQWIAIPEGMELPANRRSVDRVGVVPREFKSAEDLDGAVVNVEVLEFPEGGESAVGRVIEILGYPDDFGVDVSTCTSRT